MSWRSILQSTIALSTTEAEYMVMTEVMKKAIWLQGLLNDLGIEQDLLNINCDSMSAIYFAKNQVYHTRTKHIDVKFHFVWKILDEDDIELLKIHTKENSADIFTKVISGVNLHIVKRYSISLQLLELGEAHLDKLQMAWSIRQST